MVEINKAEKKKENRIKDIRRTSVYIPDLFPLANPERSEVTKSKGKNP